MRQVIIIAVFSIAISFIASNVAVLDAAASELMIPADQLFEYDKGNPLLPEKELLVSGAIYDRYKVTYSSVNAQRVPGWLTIPKKGKKPFPCVIVGHGLGGSKQDFDLIYGYLATRGYATFAIDAQYHGERKVEGVDILSSRWYSMREIMAQTVVDLRRAVDFLETQEDIDADRIGYLGLSMGVIIGAPFVSVEKRIRTAIMVVGGGDFEKILSDSQLLPFVLLRNTTDIPVAEVAAKFASVDPVNYIADFAPRPLLMLNAKRDNVMPPSAAKALFAAAGKPKKIIWYDSDHVPPFDKVLNHTTKWLGKFLKRAKVEKEESETVDAREYNKDDYAITGSLSGAGEGADRLVTIEAKPSLIPDSKLAPDVIVEAVFPNIDFSFELKDDGARGDARAADGIYSITLPIPLILDGVIPDSLYDCTVRIKVRGGETLAEAPAGNAMLRKAE